MQCQRSSAHVWRAPANAGACAADACVQFSHLFSSQIRGITNEWVHTPVGFQQAEQQNPAAPIPSNGIFCQFKSGNWAKSGFLSQHWWDSGTS
jgi:hypothetical protein